jgi:hypothetical protein
MEPTSEFVIMSHQSFHPQQFARSTSFNRQHSVSARSPVLDPNFKSPATNGWSLNIQREIRRQILVDVSYIGRKATNLFGAYNVNQVDILRQRLPGGLPNSCDRVRAR